VTVLLVVFELQESGEEGEAAAVRAAVPGQTREAVGADFVAFAFTLKEVMQDASLAVIAVDFMRLQDAEESRILAVFTAAFAVPEEDVFTGGLGIAAAALQQAAEGGAFVFVAVIFRAPQGDFDDRQVEVFFDPRLRLG